MANYQCFERDERWIEWPRRRLQAIQRRLVRLLDRIEPPAYMHSGFRGRSYVTNAREHEWGIRLAKIDVRKFFPSTSARYVFRCFLATFECSDDVAAVLTKLTTISGHLPTGGSTSTILSFYAYKRMFDELADLSASRGVVMSCLVDDMTFSGEAATSRFLYEVRLIAGQYGLKVHKRHCFEPGQVKVVTGVALTPQGVRLPNQRRKNLQDATSAFAAEQDPWLKVKKGEQLLGRVTEAAQIEPRFRPYISVVARQLKEARRALTARS
ncbi:MAG TPA: reverse transcriptase family protein [Verrucomicrobiae bacterium]